MTLEAVFYVLGIIFMLAYLAALAVAARLVIIISQEIKSVRDKVDSAVMSVEGVVDKLYQPKLLGVAGMVVPVLMALWKNKRRN